MPHAQDRPAAGERMENGQNDDDDSLSTTHVPREIFVRKRTDASTCKASSTGRSSGRSSRSSNSTRRRLSFSFFSRKSTRLFGAFRSKERGERQKRPRVVDEEDNEQVLGVSADRRDIDTNQNRVHDQAAEALPEAPPPTYDEALRLGLFILETRPAGEC